MLAHPRISCVHIDLFDGHCLDDNEQGREEIFNGLLWLFVFLFKQPHSVAFVMIKRNF